MQVNITASLSCLLACIDTCAFHGGWSKSPVHCTSIWSLVVLLGMIV